MPDSFLIILIPKITSAKPKSFMSKQVDKNNFGGVLVVYGGFLVTFLAR